MELTADQIFESYGKKCMLRLGSTLLPYKYEWICFSCGYNVMKRENELTKLK